MIDLYTWKTPNGQKISIMLEEVKLPYNVHLIDISKKEQFKKKFLKVSPNNKIPAITDKEGPDGKPLHLFESGAILIYLAEKTGKLLSLDPREYAITLQWLMWQMAGFGPMLGQVHHFVHYAKEKVPYAIERYTNEAKRLYGVLNTRLSEADYVAGKYSIADIAIYPWAALHEHQKISLKEYPHVKRWLKAVAARPAVKRGMKVGGE